MFSTLCQLWRKATAVTETVVLPSGPGLFRSTGKIKLFSVWETSSKVNLCQAVEVGKKFTSGSCHFPMYFILLYFQDLTSNSFRVTGIYRRLKRSFHDSSVEFKMYQVCGQLLFWSPLLLANYFCRSLSWLLPSP